MIDKDKALALLGTGLGPVDVGRTLGCDPSYISQLLMDDTFRGEVLAQRMSHLQEATKRDRNIESIEDDLIVKLKDMVPTMHRTQDILRAFAVVNAAKRRGATGAGDITMNHNVVQIVWPEAARRVFTTNHQGEVVQVDDTPTVTMPLQTLLKDRLKRKADGEREKEAGSGSTAASETKTAA